MKLYSCDCDERHDAITLPTVAVMKDDSGSYVYANANNTAQRFRVATGGEQGTRTEIVAGLNGNEDIITTGQQFVKNGGQIVVQ